MYVIGYTHTSHGHVQMNMVILHEFHMVFHMVFYMKFYMVFHMVFHIYFLFAEGVLTLLSNTAEYTLC